MQSAASSKNYRWGICGLLFLATTINYADRQILGILAPVLQTEIGWSESQYGLIVTAFQTAYAIGLLAGGRAIDLLGTRLGYALSLTWWSLAAMAHGLVSTVAGFGAVRFLLGLGEAGNFPAAVKTVAEWFPKGERAFATGIFNSGSNVGAILVPLIVPWLTIRYGWRWAFAITGGAGLLWLVAWLVLYRNPAPLPNEPPESTSPVAWLRLLDHREVWGLMLARLITDPVWWFYLYWAPKFLNTRFGLQLDQLGLPLVIIYLSADAGSIFGGWLSSRLMHHGWSANAARKTAILVCATLVLPIAAAPHVATPWMAVALLSLATAGHQGWAANIFTIVSDMVPARAVSSVVGLSGFGGSVGGMMAASAIGFLLEATHSYTLIFALASISYFAALGLVHLASPRLTPIRSDDHP